MTKVCLTILAYKGKDCLEKCIQSVLGQKTKNQNLAISLKICVLDNNSDDGTYEWLLNLKHKLDKDILHKDIELEIQANDINAGFAGGHNKLVKQNIDSCEQFILFNQDAYLEDDEAVLKLVEVSQKQNNKAIIQPVYKNFSGQYTAAGIIPTYTGLGSPSTSFLDDIADGQTEVEVPISQFGVVIIPKQVFESCGYMEEFYFMYHEDYEYCLRAALQGYKCICTTRVTIFHDQKPGRFRSKTRAHYHIERNRLHLLLTYMPLRVLVLLLPAYLLTELAMLYFTFTAGNVKAKFKGYGDLYKSFDRLLYDRKKTRVMVMNSNYRANFYDKFKANIDSTKINKDSGLSFAAKKANYVLSLFNIFFFKIFKKLV